MKNTTQNVQKLADYANEAVPEDDDELDEAIAYETALKVAEGIIRDTIFKYPRGIGFTVLTKHLAKQIVDNGYKIFPELNK